MKKAKFLILPLIFAATAATTLSACSKSSVNQGPEISGVSEVTCLANTTVDLLNGVTALDLEDGDITPDLKISITPEVPVENGYAVFPYAGEYDVCYEVKDSEGKLARTTVSANVKEREVYRDDLLTNGFALKTEGRTKVLNNGLNGGVYAFKVTGNEIAENVKLTRTYALYTDTEYTFNYHVKSNLAGKIKLAADGKSFAEETILSGETTVQFKYTAKGDSEMENVSIELWLGALDGDLEFSVSSVDTSYVQKEATLEDMVSNLNFDGKIQTRFDFNDKKPEEYRQPEGNIVLVDGGKGAYVEITKAVDENWRGGMFINTGFTMQQGITYVISYDIEAQKTGGGIDFEIVLQRDQYNGEKPFDWNHNAGPHSVEHTATNETKGALWIYIASGQYLNKITIKNFCIQKKLAAGATINQTVSVNNIYANNFEGAEGSAKCEYGKLIYDIKKFGNDWGNNELGTPAFALSGAAGNYVITFKAKATAPISFVFAASVASTWKTFAWKQLRLTTEEQVFSIRCDDTAVEGEYKFLWQFGTYANTLYSDVTVEISDIKICNLSDLDG